MDLRQPLNDEPSRHSRAPRWGTVVGTGLRAWGSADSDLGERPADGVPVPRKWDAARLQGRIGACAADM